MSSSTPGWLPIEVVSRILEIFFDKLLDDHHVWTYPEWTICCSLDPFLSPFWTAELLRLRLVCKSWATAATPICFRTVWSGSSIQAQRIIDLMTSPRQALDLSPFVRAKRLAFQDIQFWLEQEGEDIDPTLPLALSMDQVVEVITLIGHNATELTLKVSDEIMITPALVEAVSNIKGLKTLSIHGTRYYQPSEIHDPRAFSDLLAAAPNLECLVFDACNMEDLTLAPTSLSKLKHISLIDCFDSKNIEAINVICDAARDSLKCIEVVGDGDDLNSLEYPTMIEPAFETILSKLEVLFCYSVVKDVPENIIQTEFPRLRIIRNLYVSDYGEDELIGDWPIFRHVRTIVQPIFDGQEFWRSNLNYTSDDPWKPPKLRLLVFTGLCTEGEELDPDLLEALKSHGIHCRYIYEVKPDEISELDLRFNGPMESVG